MSDWFISTGNHLATPAHSAGYGTDSLFAHDGHAVEQLDNCPISV